LLVTDFTKPQYCSWYPSFVNRDVAESLLHPLMFTSHRSGSSASISTTSRPSPSLVSPSLPISSSTASLTAIPQRAPTASRVSSMSSRSRRTRFSSDPPYSSWRSLKRRERSCIGSVSMCPA